MGKLDLYWGDSHTNLHLGQPDWIAPAATAPAGADLRARFTAELEERLKHACQVLDFWPVAYYPHTYEQVNGLKMETWLPDEPLEAGWAAICDLAARHNAPGELVIFPGFEWQGDGRDGDHNVFFAEDHPPLLRSERLVDLYDEIRRCGCRALAIPHHTAYMPGVRSKDWGVHDERISPFAEVYSQHGCSETDEEWIGLRRNQHMGPGVSGATIADALDRGIKVGIIASTDGHHNIAGVHGWGLMACYAEQLTRESLWEAFAARRVYGVTGDRIELDFSVEGAMMGAAIDRRGPVRCLVKVRGGDAIDRIELLRNNRVVATHCHSGTWEPPRGPERIRCKLRVEAGWGHRPGEIPELPPRDWQCSIEVVGGVVHAAEPCWKTAGQWIGPLGGSRCEFGFHTATRPAHGRDPTEATVFELEGRPDDAVTIRLDTQTVTTTLGEAMARSRIVHFMDEAGELVRRTCGVDPAQLKRKDRLYYIGNKVKLHRAIPEPGLSAELDYVDADPPAGENFYRVRVQQRNGQAAWSSPVWVRNP